MKTPLLLLASLCLTFAAEPPKAAPKESPMPPELKALIDDDTAEVLKFSAVSTAYRLTRFPNSG
jgi:hypothetical protein